MNPIPTKCPVCGGDLVVSKLHCPSCETTISGSFASLSSPLQEAFTSDQLRSLLPFARLNKEQLYFMLTFMRCEGRLNRMEDELSLSYPTLRNRLDEIIRALGFEPARDDARGDAARTDAARGDAGLRGEAGEAAGAGEAPRHLPGPAERQAILDMLNRGEINVDDARRRLRGEAAPHATAQAQVYPPLDAEDSASRVVSPLNAADSAGRVIPPLDTALQAEEALPAMHFAPLDAAPQAGQEEDKPVNQTEPPDEAVGPEDMESKNSTNSTEE